VTPRELALSPDIFERQILPRLTFEGDCWLWTGALRGGERRYGERYGVIRVRPHGLFYVHRVVFHLLVRPLEAEEVVDHGHDCGLGHCVNPTYLQATSRENNARLAAAVTNGYGRQEEEMIF
jgi:hypothetical protein